MAEPPILATEGLRKHFVQEQGIVRGLLGGRPDVVHAVDDVTVDLHRNEAKGIIGESGCGKTTLLRTLAGLYEPTAGTVRFRGRDTREFDRRDWRAFRGEVQLVFQDPFNSFDPRYTVEASLREQAQIHSLDDPDGRIRDVLDDVELQPADDYLDRRPAQLSGGELQRVSIARALVVEPTVLLADEPVSMLDVSTQAAVLNLIAGLVDEHDLSLLYISHDLSTVSHVCGDIEVMYLGRVIEKAPTVDLIEEPRHPYTQALINAVPVPDTTHERARTALEGTPGDPINVGEGCRFRDRCPERMDVCEVTPRMTAVADDHRTACHLYYDHAEVAGGGAQEARR